MTSNQGGVAKSTAEMNRRHYDEKATVYDISMSKSIEPIIEKLRECKELLQVPWINDEDSSDEENDDDDDTDSYEDAHDSENDGESRRDRRNYSPQKDGEPPWEVFEIPESLDNSEEGRTLQLLDYACGTGLATRAFAEFTTRCVGIDVSGEMVYEYNMRAHYQGLYPHKMLAVRGDLTDPHDPAPPALAHGALFGFDVAVCVLAMHHFADPALAAARLAQRLRPGGVLCVVDFLEDGPPGELDPETRRRYDYTVEHRGFGRGQVAAVFAGAGVGEGFELVEIGSGYTTSCAGERQNRTLFLARGQKGRLIAEP